MVNGIYLPRNTDNKELKSGLQSNYGNFIKNYGTFAEQTARHLHSAIMCIYFVNYLQPAQIPLLPMHYTKPT